MKASPSIKIATLIVVTLIVCSSFVSNAAGQSRRDAPPRNADEQRTSGANEQSESGCAKRYDRFRNHNTVTIEPRTILRAGTDELKLGASAVSEGDNNTAPREIDLLFDSTTNRLRYGNSAEVRFRLDGKRMEGGTAYKMGGSAMRQVNEKLRLTMPASRFLEIINGREVEMQLGETEVTLRREDLQRLRDFAACVNLRAE